MPDIKTVRIDEFLPTIQFGFQLDKDKKEVLHQLWITPTGLTEWRPVPMVQLDDFRKPSIAGWVNEEDE